MLIPQYSILNLKRGGYSVKKFKFSKFMSVFLAVFITFFTSIPNVQAAALTRQSKPTTTKTTVQSAYTNEAGNIVTIAFNKQMQDPTGKHTLFKVIINDSVQTPISALLNNNNSFIDFNIATQAKHGDTIKISYTASSPKTAIKSIDGVSLSSFSNFQVINKVPAAVVETIKYVSLGDSIATGTTGTGRTTSFPYLFRNYLEQIYYPKINVGAKVELIQHAINGLTTPMLIANLTVGDTYYVETMASDVKNANIITLSIGGNDLMQHAEIPGFKTVDWVKSQESADYFVTTAWVQLVSIIKTLNPTARLIVNTGYNPFNLEAVNGYESDVALTIAGFSFSGKTEELVTYINSIIISKAPELQYEVANVYNHFHTIYGLTSMGQVNLFYPYLLGIIPTPLLRDPHPNQYGQNIISNLFKAFYPVN